MDGRAQKKLSTLWGARVVKLPRRGLAERRRSNAVLGEFRLALEVDTERRSIEAREREDLAGDLEHRDLRVERDVASAPVRERQQLRSSSAFTRLDARGPWRPGS
jgi:hypothetical protein